MTVCSVAGPVGYGESIDGILADNPDPSREAIEAAVVYAGKSTRWPFRRKAVATLNVM
jgi:uncharacterized protein (DUF433 family)